MNYDKRQFKLVTGEEIICEVVDWSANEALDLITIRNPMTIVYGPMTDRGGDTVRGAILMPSMFHQLKDGTFQTLSMAHVTIEGIPTAALVEYYESVLTQSLPKEEVDEDDDEFEDSDEDIIKFPTVSGNKNKIH